MLRKAVKVNGYILDEAAVLFSLRVPFSMGGSLLKEKISFPQELILFRADS